MSILEPLPSQAPRGTDKRTGTGNPYTGRWRWWYSAIADEMLANPRATHAEIAKKIGRATTTVGYIVATDMFREYYARRRAEYSRAHDEALRNKVLGVAEASLDVLTTQFKTKGDQVPMKLAAEVATGMLEALGYGAPAAPQVVVNNTQDNSTKQVVVTQASLSELEAARAALQAAEARRIEAPPVSTPAGPVGADVEQLMEDRQGASIE